MTPENLRERFASFGWEDKRYIELSENSVSENSKTSAKFVLSSLAKNMSYRNAIGVEREFHEADHNLTGNYTEDELSQFGQSAPAPNVYKTTYGQYQAVTGDIINGLKSKAWSYSPTIFVDLPHDIKRAAAEAAIDSLSQYDPNQLSDAAFIRLIGQYKERAVDFVNERAAKGVSEAEKVISDMLQENDFAKEYKKFYDYAGMYPISVMGAELVSNRKLAWNDNRLSEVQQVSLRHRCYDPACVYPSPDAVSNIRDCENLVIVERATQHDLMDMMQNPAYEKGAIKKILDKLIGKDSTSNKSKNRWDWACWSTDDYQWEPSVYDVAKCFSQLMPTGNGIPVIRFNGRIAGYQIKMFKDHSNEEVDDYTSYEVEIYIIADQEIRFAIDPYIANQRPFASESYSSTPNSIYGDSPISLMREPARDFRGFARDLYFNSTEATYPMVEINIDRLASDEDGLMDDEDREYGAGSVVETQADPMQGNSRAVRRDYGEDKASSLISKMQFAKAEIHEVTGISPQLTGFSSTAAGNRTGKVFTAGIRNSLKKYADFVDRVDENVLSVLLGITYRMYLAYTDTTNQKYDANVIVNGSIKLLEKEGQQEQLGLILQNLTQATQYRDEEGLPLVSSALYRAILTDWLESNGSSPGSLLEDPRGVASITSIGQPPVQPVAQDASAPLPELDGRSA